MTSPTTAADNYAQIKSLTFRTQAFINGNYVGAASGQTFDCISPLNGQSLTSISACDAEDVDHAVKAARTVFEQGTWSHMPPAERKAILLAFSHLIEHHASELALLETIDMGKPISVAQEEDITSVAETIAWYAEACDKIYDEVAPATPHSIGLITREPLGIIAAIVPWNYPLLMAAWKFAPALAAGNSVIVKPAEQSPLTCLRVAELASQAGIPDGVFQVLPGYGETAGQALGRHMDVDMVTFTGSTEIGKRFLCYAGESNMKHVSLECGGKTPNIIFADAPDLDAAAYDAGMAIFHNSGQVCSASSRLLIEDSIHDSFLSAVQKVCADMIPADPLDPETTMGSMVDKNQMDRVLAYIQAGKQQGAELISGGSQVRQNTGGYFIEPTIFDRVTNDMRIAQEEIFGPVLSVLTFKDPKEAIFIANDTSYGLQASVWTRDINKAHKVARRLKAGSVNINNTDGGDISMPFGGYKQSGIGRDLSLHAYDKYTQLKSTYIELT
ncbi:MAG: aldehyde dehydrogenase [Parvibaculaceae bacterium]|nr:aldehyde dehydrogenase [Parvibaculaceae bacterium]